MVLRIAVPMVVLASAAVSGPRAVAASLTLLSLLWLYNDFDFPPGKLFPVWRNFLNSLGIASFGWGAIVALEPERLPVPITWLGITAAVTFTTIQSQDLPGMYMLSCHI